MTTAVSLPVPNNWINDRFGSKRGLVRYTYFESKRLMGHFDSLLVEKNFQPNRLVFVCVGNICRSPIAELIAKSNGIDAISYGLRTRGDDPADSRAIDFARKYGFDLTNHRTRRIDQYYHRHDDLVVAMEPKHLPPLIERYSNANVTLLGLYNDNPKSYIHDPYNTNTTYFKNCEELIITATVSLVKHVS